MTLSRKDEVGGIVNRGGFSFGVTGGESGVTKDWKSDSLMFSFEFDDGSITVGCGCGCGDSPPGDGFGISEVVDVDVEVVIAAGGSDGEVTVERDGVLGLVMRGDAVVTVTDGVVADDDSAGLVVGASVKETLVVFSSDLLVSLVVVVVVEGRGLLVGVKADVEVEVKAEEPLGEMAVVEVDPSTEVDKVVDVVVVEEEVEVEIGGGVLVPLVLKRLMVMPILVPPAEEMAESRLGL